MAYGNVGGSAGGGRERSKGTSKGGMRSGPPGGMKSSPGGNPKSAGKSTAGAGADKAKRSSSAMSKARWDNMTDTMKRKEYGTTSYKKYIESSYSKAGPRQGKVSSSRNTRSFKIPPSFYSKPNKAKSS